MFVLTVKCAHIILTVIWYCYINKVEDTLNAMNVVYIEILDITWRCVLHMQAL